MNRLIIIVLSLVYLPLAIAEPKCLWVSSYAPGYKWNDGIELGLKSTLKGQCELKIFHMDTKRNKSSEFGKAQALKAKALIETYKPDVVIASDDNASRYLVVPYYKNASQPIVVYGINGSPKAHGYPFSNVTGMIEVEQISPLLSVVNKIVNVRNPKIMIIAPDTNTSRSDIKYSARHFKRAGMEVTARYVNTLSQWKTAFRDAQNLDVVLLANNAGVKDWNNKDVEKFAKEHSKKLSISMHDWMKSYAMIVYAKRAEEQGEWAGKVTIEILNGASPANIPLTVNKDWDQFINTNLLESANVKLGRQFIKNSITE